MTPHASVDVTVYLGLGMDLAPQRDRSLYD
jgi:hypothetical protein